LSIEIADCRLGGWGSVSNGQSQSTIQSQLVNSTISIGNPESQSTIGNQ
jgi:hypothetical protein